MLMPIPTLTLIYVIIKFIILNSITHLPQLIPIQHYHHYFLIVLKLPFSYRYHCYFITVIVIVTVTIMASYF